MPRNWPIVLGFFILLRITTKSTKELLPLHHIPDAQVTPTIDGQHKKLRYSTKQATFSLYPVDGQTQTFDLIITPRDLIGRFKNSGFSTFGKFRLVRLPGRNSVVRLPQTKPISGNAVLMWPNVNDTEKVKCLDYLEKLIRSELPRMTA